MMVTEEKTAGQLADPEKTVCADVHPRAGTICDGCRAHQTGRNCWEMDVSPCCDLPREWCSTCPVYIAAMRELTVPEKAVIYMTGGSIIKGIIHVRKTMRLSDELNDTEDDFIAVTKADIDHSNDSEPDNASDPHEVIILSKNAIAQIIPVDEKAYEDADGTDTPTNHDDGGGGGSRRRGAGGDAPLKVSEDEQAVGRLGQGETPRRPV